MKYKFNVKNNIMNHFPVYLFFCILIPVILASTLSSKNTLKRNQIISLFIASGDIQKSDELINKMKEITASNGIKKATINCISPTSEMFYNQFTTIGLESSDLILLPKSVIEDESLNYIFCSINSDNAFYNDSNYIYNEEHYGLLAHSNTYSCLDEYVTYNEEEYYFFLPNKSPHLLGFKEESKTNSTYLLLENFVK